MEKIIATFYKGKSLEIIYNMTDDTLLDQIEMMTRRNKSIKSVEVIKIYSSFKTC